MMIATAIKNRHNPTPIPISVFAFVVIVVVICSEEVKVMLSDVEVIKLSFVGSVEVDIIDSKKFQENRNKTINVLSTSITHKK